MLGDWSTILPDVYILIHILPKATYKSSQKLQTEIDFFFRNCHLQHFSKLREQIFAAFRKLQQTFQKKKEEIRCLKKTKF